MSSKKQNMYTITVNEKQMRTIEFACELVSRIGMGQWEEIIHYLPAAQKGFSFLDENDRVAIDLILKKHMGLSPRACYGIHSPEVTEDARISFDIYQVLRHRLSWDYAIENKLTNSDGTRNWSNMLTVNYDEPMKASDAHDLPTVVKKGEE